MIATTIEQSKHLIEIGVDVSTADMYYEQSYLGKDGYFDPTPIVISEPICFEEHLLSLVPAWSLTALLELINSDYKLEKFMLDQSFEFRYAIHIDGVHYTREHNNPLDAAFEMVVWLKENDKI